MTVDYELEPADLLEISKERHQFRSDSLSRLYYFGILPILGTGLAVATESFLTAAAFMILFVTSGWLVQDRIQRAYKRSIYSEQNLAFIVRRWRAAVTADGVRISSDAAEVLYRWPFIRKVFRGSRFVQIELTPVQKVHIPVRAFRDNEHILTFIADANSHIKTVAK